MGQVDHEKPEDPVHYSFGYLARTWCKKRLPVEVLKSAAGFYIGTCDEDGPVSRESQYFPTSELAQQALESGTWVQRHEP
jgi:hypothetical protein